MQIADGQHFDGAGQTNMHFFAGKMPVPEIPGQQQTQQKGQNGKPQNGTPRSRDHITEME